MTAAPAPLAPPLRAVTATRYVLPLREGGSLPALMEADDLGTYVVKFRGAGQGRKALIAEILGAALARLAGLRVPELVLIEMDPLLARSEPDPEIQDLLRASAGLNLGVDYLPGSLGFNPAIDPVEPDEAAAVLWFDALTLNVDRSWRNPNLLRWHGQMWAIDHGASLYFAHNWAGRKAAIPRAYEQAGEHALLALASSPAAAHERLAPAFTEGAIAEAAAAIPDQWLEDEPGFGSPEEVRAAYAEVLLGRLAQAGAWLPALEAAQHQGKEDARAHL